MNAAIIAIAATAPMTPNCDKVCNPNMPKLAAPSRNGTALSSIQRMPDDGRKLRSRLRGKLLTYASDLAA